MALKSDGNKVMTTVILTRTQKQRLDEQAERLGIRVSALIRLAVARWLDEQPTRRTEGGDEECTKT